MNINDFDFTLPDQLIAQFPIKQRSHSRLLVAKPNAPLIDRYFFDLPSFLNQGDVLVLNDTKVIKARLFGQKDSGGAIEVLIERIIDENRALLHIRASNAPKINSKIYFNDGIEAMILERCDHLYLARFNSTKNIFEVLEQFGTLPLPPYIHHTPTDRDSQRYQTVYAQKKGAIAAPTAGLHFTEELLNQLLQKGVVIAKITLHVGSGTFQPIRVKNIEEHKMHKEFLTIEEDVCNLINTAKEKGNKIYAVGTTSLRALESAANQKNRIFPVKKETDIFITPGYQFKIVDRLITNFHLPKSTLLLLVSAFSGTEEIKKIYQHAIEEGYKFFSYGDATLLYLKHKS